jgi:hypothetical protein
VLWRAIAGAFRHDRANRPCVRKSSRRRGGRYEMKIAVLAAALL